MEKNNLNTECHIDTRSHISPSVSFCFSDAERTVYIFIIDARNGNWMDRVSVHFTLCVHNKFFSLKKYINLM